MGLYNYTVKNKYIDIYKKCIDNVQKTINKRYDEDRYDLTHVDTRYFGADIEKLMISELKKLDIYGYHDGSLKSVDPDFICIKNKKFTTEFKSHLIHNNDNYTKYKYAIDRNSSKSKSNYYNNQSFTLILINYKFKPKYKYICKEDSYRDNMHEFIITDFYIVYDCTFKNLPDAVYLKSNGELNIEDTHFYEHIIL